MLSTSSNEVDVRYLFQKPSDCDVLQGRDVLYQVLLGLDELNRGCHTLRQLERVKLNFKPAIQIG